MFEGRLHHELYKFAERVQPIYALLKWEWAGKGNRKGGVPTVEDIHDELFELYQELEKKNKQTRIECGGLFFELTGEGFFEFGMTTAGPFFAAGEKYDGFHE